MRTVITIVDSIGETAILKNPDIATFQRSVAFLRPNEDTISIILKTEIDTDIFQKELADRKSQSAQPGVYLGELEKIPFYLTSIPEQQKIGTFFSNLDTLITLHQREYFSFDFNSRSAKIAQNTLSWEQRKLSDTLNFLSNNTLSRAELSEDTGTYKDVHYGDVLIKYGEYIDAQSTDRRYFDIRACRLRKSRQSIILPQFH
jgi:hypothetical protein